MRPTVFTPSHRPRYLDACYASLVSQTMSDWEWVVSLNGNASSWRPRAKDDRVLLVHERGVRGVGAAKRAACAQGEGEVLVELDHDDLLAPSCLERVVAAFEAAPSAALVYSDFTQINEDGSPNHDRFNADYGWRYDDVEIDGTTYLRCHALAPSPHNLGYIWYAPNHVRAFSRAAYEQVGGYDPAWEILDDQELMARLYLAGEFVHVPECLYLQRVHRANTQANARTNAAIQAHTVTTYHNTIVPLARANAERHGLAELDLRLTDPLTAEREPRGAVVELDPSAPKLAWPDSSVGLIHATELLQFLPDRAAFFNECYRVLAHGGLLFTETPSTDGRGAFQDPRHVSWWNENSFWYVTQAGLSRAVAGLEARFQVSNLRTHHPTEWHEQASIAYVQANLLAIKDGPRQGGPLLC